MFASGAVMGLSVGGTIIQNYGWRTTFFTIIPIAITLLLIIRRLINVNEGRQQQQSQRQKETKPIEDKNIGQTKKRPRILAIKNQQIELT